MITNKEVVNFGQFRLMSNKDLQYERANAAYDCERGFTPLTFGEYDENGIKCKNYKLCEAILPSWWFECKANYLCMNCDSFGWKELEFKESTEECAVCCNESNFTKVKFPADCGHWFCAPCSRHILFYDEERYHLSPILFGCPPCPNRCINPSKGKQCQCEEYDDILDRWEKDYPKDYQDYNDAETLSIELKETTLGSVFGSRTCPLCRLRV